MSTPKRYRACKTFSGQLVNFLCQDDSAARAAPSTDSSIQTPDHNPEHPEPSSIHSSEPHNPHIQSDDNSSSSQYSVPSNNLNNLSPHTSQESFQAELTSWFVESNISNELGNKLLKILSKKIHGLPNDVRTLKKTPTDAPIVQLGDGEYVHYSLMDGITDFLKDNVIETNELELNINIDGLPISKSSKKNVWPILINVNGTDSVFVAGIFSGCSHPKDANAYLKPFVDEMKYLIENGLVFQSKCFKINCRAFICDAPARAFILGTKGHSGYSCCTKCTIKGERCEKRTFFPFEINSARTNEDFRNRSDVAHHKQQTPIVLENLPIDMIKQFPIDYMHVVCLGVVKALLMSWVKVKNKKFSLGNPKINILNSRLLFAKSQIPKEFCRKTRELAELERFKATEFRLFLLYVGPIVLKSVLDDDRYNHFLKLSLSIRILLDPINCQKNNICASQMLNDFVKEIPQFYDRIMLTYNVHCLTHLAADSVEFGSLETINAFKFENYLGQLKKLVKKNHQLAPQLYNRLVERSMHTIKKEVNSQILGPFIEDSYNLFEQTISIFHRKVLITFIASKIQFSKLKQL